MLRHITAILLLIAFGVHTFRGTAIVLDYYTDTESFAERCINKLRPAMHCNGKCLLMQKLKETEKKDQQAPERKIETKADYTCTKILPLSHPFLVISSTHQSFFFENLLAGCDACVFHPPAEV